MMYAALYTKYAIMEQLYDENELSVMVLRPSLNRRGFPATAKQIVKVGIADTCIYYHSQADSAETVKVDGAKGD